MRMLGSWRGKVRAYSRNAIQRRANRRKLTSTSTPVLMTLCWFLVICCCCCRLQLMATRWTQLPLLPFWQSHLFPLPWCCHTNTLTHAHTLVAERTGIYTKVNTATTHICASTHTQTHTHTRTIKARTGEQRVWWTLSLVLKSTCKSLSFGLFLMAKNITQFRICNALFARR